MKTRSCIKDHGEKSNRIKVFNPTATKEVQENLPPVRLFIKKEPRTAVYQKMTGEVRISAGKSSRQIKEEMR